MNIEKKIETCINRANDVQYQIYRLAEQLEAKHQKSSDTKLLAAINHLKEAGLYIDDTKQLLGRCFVDIE